MPLNPNSYGVLLPVGAGFLWLGTAIFSRAEVEAEVAKDMDTDADTDADTDTDTDVSDSDPEERVYWERPVRPVRKRKRRPPPADDVLVAETPQ